MVGWTRHFDILAQFEAKVADNPDFKSLGSAQKWEVMTAPQRLITLQMAIKVPESATDASPIINPIVLLVPFHARCSHDISTINSIVRPETWFRV